MEKDKREKQKRRMDQYLRAKERKEKEELDYLRKNNMYMKTNRRVDPDSSAFKKSYKRQISTAKRNQAWRLN